MRSCSEFKKTRTKYGVFNVGWPKFDFLLNKKILLKLGKKLFKNIKLTQKK